MIQLDLPLSINALLNRTLNRVIELKQRYYDSQSSKIEDFKHLIQDDDLRPIRLNVQFYMSKTSDIDNRLKCLLDMLQHFHVIKNDRNIHELVVQKIICNKRVD